MVILQQYFDLTDKQTCFTLSTSIAWQTALNITDPNDKTCYVSPRTLWDFRHKLIESGLYKPIFDDVTIVLAKCNDVNLETQRLDSTHFQSNMKKLSRLGVFIRTINEFLKRLKKNHRDIFDQIDQELVTRYMSGDSSDNSYFGSKKPSENQRTLEQAAHDLLLSGQQFRGSAPGSSDDEL
jgi:hypothetical protein